MSLRIYRLTSSSATTAVGQASTVVVAKGKIKQVVLNGAYNAGANIGRISFEAALNNTSNGNAETATGAPSEVLVARMNTGLTTNTASTNNMVVPVDIPVQPGNTLCINVMQASGTAPSVALHGVDFYVQE